MSVSSIPVVTVRHSVGDIVHQRIADGDALRLKDAILSGDYQTNKLVKSSYGESRQVPFMSMSNATTDIMELLLSLVFLHAANLMISIVFHHSVYYRGY